MDKDSNKHLVGQPILKQIVNLVPRSLFDKLVFEQASDIKNVDPNFSFLMGQSCYPPLAYMSESQHTTDKNVDINQSMHTVESSVRFPDKVLKSIRLPGEKHFLFHKISLINSG